MRASEAHLGDENRPWGAAPVAAKQPFCGGLDRYAPFVDATPPVVTLDSSDFTFARHVLQIALFASDSTEAPLVPSSLLGTPRQSRIPPHDMGTVLDEGGACSLDVARAGQVLWSLTCLAVIRAPILGETACPFT